MNNKIREFERNRYFSGKLLTVNDFMTEQRYYNDKRRFLNRILHGAGVISGLRVVRVDGQNVTLEPGAALDHWGREIVVFRPKNFKLSSFKDFLNDTYDKNVYLCLAYAETETEAVYSAVNASVSDTGDKLRENSRYTESYRVYVTETPPAPEKVDAWRLMYRTSELYKGDGVRVLMQTPRYVQVGEAPEVKVRVETILKVQDLSLQCQATLSEGKSDQALGHVQLQAESGGKQTTVETVGQFGLNITAAAGETLHISIRSEDTLLQLGDASLLLPRDVAHEIEVVEGSVTDRLLHDYLTRPLSEFVEPTDDERIYLAKINLVKEASGYRIEQVEEVPFGQYVYNSTILRQLEGLRTGDVNDAEPTYQPIQRAVTGEQLAVVREDFVIHTSTDYLPADKKPQLAVDYDSKNREFHFQLGIPAPEVHRESTKITTGVVTIPLQGAGKWYTGLLTKTTRGYFSEEIPHGLGAGNVYVMAGIETELKDVAAEINNRDECVYYGDLDVFEESQFELDQPNVSIGTMLYPKKGTFRIGVKPQEPTQHPEVRIRWWAFQTMEGEQRRDAFVPLKREAAAGEEEK